MYRLSESTQNPWMDGYFPMLRFECVAFITFDELLVWLVLVSIETSKCQVKNQWNSVEFLNSFKFSWFNNHNINISSKEPQRFYMLLNLWEIHPFFRGSKKHRRQQRKTNRHKAIGFVFVDMWFMMFSGPFKKLPLQLNERLFIATCLFANVIFVGTFQVFFINWNI